MQVLWNNRMTKTAGYCVYKKCRNDKSCRIELSAKVCDTAGKCLGPFPPPPKKTKIAFFIPKLGENVKDWIFLFVDY